MTPFIELIYFLSPIYQAMYMGLSLWSLFVTTPPEAATLSSSPLVESKLYRLNASENFLAFLAPDINTQMIVETEIDEGFARTEADGDDTRIFINYTNHNNKSMIFKVTDNQRLSRSFDIDTFINGFFAHVNEGLSYEDLIELIRPSLVVAINTAVVNALELTDEKVSVAEKVTSTVVLQSLISILFNDPKDVIILINEQPVKDGDGETAPVILGTWTVKHRD